MHTIVYLDQNYLSNMAKARIGAIKDRAVARFWSSLFDDLKEGVLANKIACPQLSFQETEARFDRRIEEPVREVIDELSWGLRFHLYQDILETQIEDVARNFVGKQPGKREPWAIAFESDPYADVDTRMTDVFGVRTRINVHLSLPEEVAEQDRQLKQTFVDVTQELLNKHVHNRPSDLPEALVESKKSSVDGYMGNLAIQSIAQRFQSDSPWDQLSARHQLARLSNLWDRLHQIGINTHDSRMVMTFLESRELLDSPFIDVFSSIYAVLATHYQHRRMRPGDFYDVPVLATALPYCDVITTDVFMKEVLVQILRFDDKYKAKILSATRQDRLAFHELVKRPGEQSD